MIVNPITDGIVLDHIQAGRAMEIYKFLNLGSLSCTVAVILNADSVKMGKKDILKICEPIELDLAVLGYLDPGITVTYIQGGEKVRRVHLSLPDQVEDVIRCKNPRCITSTEPDLPQVFRLADRDAGTYRCIYCESKAK